MALSIPFTSTAPQIHEGPSSRSPSQDYALPQEVTFSQQPIGFTRQDEVGRLPALGWNSWNAYGCDINESTFLFAAENLVSKGFQAAGYEYVNIDDCWSSKSGRDDVTQQLLPDTSKFPNGISGLADKVHAMGLKLGIYSSSGTYTCAGYPASIGYESIDAATFAAWGIDYLKYDNCNVPGNWSDSCQYCVPDPFFGWTEVNGTCVDGDQANFCQPGYNYTQSNTTERFRIMRNALLAQNRTILYSLCEWGEAKVWLWGNETAESWRTSNDINPSFSRILEILNENSFLSNYANFYGHNDPDMLEVGNGHLTAAETRTHFALWAIMKAPLIIGTDLSTISQADVDILLNPYLLAFNQDPVFGAPAAPYRWGVNEDWTWNITNPAEYWAGQSTNGTIVAMFNSLDDEKRTMRADWKAVPELRHKDKYGVVDVWTGQGLGCFEEGVNISVNSHDTAVFLVQDTCG
ncbi:putative alpha-galactosidase B [Teratosphaeria nubilosa]|uniref:Alpha-galactosidase n=1 Tax=Teratosphaeria nubilosa TaxID=161662 RepID=A0A6G1KWQ4_9PEZI|nr:putative alpha-galactosidase B [Teratosphaeria nubilosa]